MAAKVVWGLDIGNSALKAVKMERQGTEAKVVDFDIISIAEVMVPLSDSLKLSGTPKEAITSSWLLPMATSPTLSVSIKNDKGDRPEENLS